MIFLLMVVWRAFMESQGPPMIGIRVADIS